MMGAWVAVVEAAAAAAVVVAAALVAVEEETEGDWAFTFAEAFVVEADADVLVDSVTWPLEDIVALVLDGETPLAFPFVFELSFDSLLAVSLLAEFSLLYWLLRRLPRGLPFFVKKFIIKLE